ncbi:hypothetical protein LCGC14_0673920 [marine sediment metagenome]|uniref:Uncharacterized protein n=1 Tax=marine sediment metagenome TaxID=412755 RepID=A0A0F9QVB8_9ZZZZ
MAVEKITGWRISSGEMFNFEKDALKAESLIQVRKAVNACTYEGELELNDFLKMLKKDKDLSDQFKFLTS